MTYKKKSLKNKHLQVHHGGKASEKGVHCHCQRLTQTQLLFPEHIFFFLSGFSFTNIHYSKDSRGRRRLSLVLVLSTISNRFRDIQILAGRALQRAHFCLFPAAGSNRESFVSKLNFLTVKLRVTLMQFFFSLLATFLKNVRIMTVR